MIIIIIIIIDTCMYIYIYTQLYVCVIYIYIYIHVCACMCVYIYIYIHVILYNAIHNYLLLLFLLLNLETLLSYLLLGAGRARDCTRGGAPGRPGPLQGLKASIIYLSIYL